MMIFFSMAAFTHRLMDDYMSFITPPWSVCGTLSLSLSLWFSKSDWYGEKFFIYSNLICNEGYTGIGITFFNLRPPNTSRGTLNTNCPFILETACRSANCRLDEKVPDWRGKQTEHGRQVQLEERSDLTSWDHPLSLWRI